MRNYKTKRKIKRKRKGKTKKIRDIKTRRLIYNTLKKHYMNYNEKIWKKILTEKDWEDYLNKNWLDVNKNRDHGGYLTPGEMKELMGNDAILPKELPSLKIEKNVAIIKIPTCTYNSKKYQKEYIQILRRFLMEYEAEILRLDLSENGGGKTEVIASGLLPLFLLQSNKSLTYIVDSKKMRKSGLKIVDNEISNLPVDVPKAKKMETIPKKIDVVISKQTASAGEQIVLALKVMNEIIPVEYKGEPSAGFTTWIEYIDLPNGGGLEYPVGTMTSFSGIKSRSDGKLYPDDLNSQCKGGGWGLP
jgi:hypothetical protein